MSVPVNLLPAAYRQARRRGRRLRAGIVLGCLVLATEGLAGFALRLRASDTRALIAATDSDRAELRSLKRDIETPERQVDGIERQVAVAERLRAKHRWSRLLTALAQATPERVVITAVSTDPPQWTPALRAAMVSGGGMVTTGETRRLIDGIMISGHAADHADLSAFVSEMYRGGLFSMIELRQVRRDRLMERDVIVFELNCRW